MTDPRWTKRQIRAAYRRADYGMFRPPIERILAELPQVAAVEGPAQPPATHEFTLAPRNSDPGWEGRCWRMYWGLVCGLPADDPVHVQRGADTPQLQLNSNSELKLELARGVDTPQPEPAKACMVPTCGCDGRDHP